MFLNKQQKLIKMIARKIKNNLKDFNNNKYTILINRANQCDNPLKQLQISNEYNFDNQKFEVSCSRSSNLSVDVIDWVAQLTEQNMRTLFERSEWGWDKSNKRKELTHRTAYLLLVKDKLKDEYCAFAHFRFEFDDAKIKGIIYCYELQIAENYQRNGIGSMLMKLIKDIGIKFKMCKVLLTCFVYNQAAMDFYVKKLDYRIDRTSPSKCVEGITFYEILSLKIN